MDKNIEKRISQLDSEIEYHKGLVKIHTKKVNELILTRKVLTASKDIEVKDHAIMQYLRRVGTAIINPDVFRNETLKIQEEILAEHKDTIIKYGGNLTITYKGVSFIVKDYKIITVIDRNK